MTFVSAVMKTPNETRTENGMKTYGTSLKNTVDLFFKIGASRGMDISSNFERAFQEDSDITLRTLLWARDVRGGAGERQIFRDMLKFMEKNHPQELKQILHKVPEMGRWDDLLVFETTEFKTLAYIMIGDALRDNNGLCAKWMPRKGLIAVEIRNFFGMTPKRYRKALVGLTNVVEQKMCAKDWNSIEFGKLPSLAAARYQKAFGRNATHAYTRYKEALVKGEAKINAGAVYPYDVLKSIRTGDTVVAKAQWDALPNYVGDAKILPMVDVSGSMCTPVGGGGTLSCLDVSVSLGLYLADKNTGAFKDCFLTFSEASKIEVLRGDIVSKHRQLMTSNWGMSTNLHAAFEEVLRVATTQKVAHKDMPEYILIMSDMQFNACTRHDHSAMQMIEDKYTKAGYEVPKIIFWNIQSRNDNVPVTFDKKGTALISGFSPSIVRSVLKAEQVTPEEIMLETVNNSRYDYK